ncbi:MAG: ATP-binding protein [Candidatus Cloacimonadota bacterium]|nr:MAG: ATP-binding protein [Candidatus Cloacimonadota bacterium]
MIKIKIKNNLEELNKLTNIIEGFCAENDIGMKITFQLNLIFEEIISNIVSYGYNDKSSHDIMVELDLKDDLLTCVISDDGISFDPLIVEKPKLDEGVEERKIGGLGIHFVKSMINDISYKRNNGKNILKFTKKINPEA